MGSERFVFQMMWKHFQSENLVQRQNQGSCFASLYRFNLVGFAFTLQSPKILY